MTKKNGPTVLVLDPSAMLTLNDWAKKVKASKSLVAKWLAQGRIVGATQVGRSWLVPKDAPRPPKLPRGRGKRSLSAAQREAWPNRRKDKEGAPKGRP